MFKFFKKPAPEVPKNDPAVRNHHPEVKAVQPAVPAIFLNKMPQPDLPGAPGCWIGGLPSLPPEIEWPWYVYKNEPLAPMHFIAQIRLDCLPKAEGLPDLPATGTLFFFHACLLHCYLDAPGNDERGCRVIHVDADVSTYPHRPMPAFPAFSALPIEDWQPIFEQENTRIGPLDQWNVDFKLFDTYPLYSEMANKVGGPIIDELRKESYERTKHVTKAHIDEGALHHMFGEDITGVGPSRVGERNLLSIDSEPDIGTGDLHHVQCTQFIIHEKDLKRRNWSAVTLGGGGS